MPTSTNVTNLKINELTEAQYDTAVSGGVIGANEISILTDVDEAIQVSTMPTAGADELGKVYQFIGTTDANYTHGYFYECTGAGEPVVYSWSRVDVQPSSSLPSQTGNAGKFLTTDGTDASWGTDVAQSMNIVYDLSSSSSYMVKLSAFSTQGSIYFYQGTTVKTGITFYPTFISVGGCFNVEANALYPISFTDTLGKSSDKWGTAYIKKLNNGNNITIPTVAGSMAVQVSTVPTANSTLEGQIYQFVGTTDSTYTNGHFYKCVSDGQDPATYSWEEVQLGGGGSSYTAGTGIDITSGVISVTSPTLQNAATGTDSVGLIGTTTSNNSVVIGKNAQVNWNGGIAIGYGSKAQGIAIGYNAKSNSDYGNSVAIGGDVETKTQQSIAIGGGSSDNSNKKGIVIGYFCKTDAVGAIQIGWGTNSTNKATNSDANTVKISNANGNFEIMSADGTIPAARHASLPASDGTYVLKLVISGGVPTLSWVAE